MDSHSQEQRNDKLILAARAGNTTDVEACLNAGAQINALARSVTALMAAAEYGHLHTVYFLLAKGAPLNTVSAQNQNTALMYASIHNRTAVVDVLIKAGADIHCQNVYGNTALFLAIACKAEQADNQTAFRLLSAMSIPEIVAIQDNTRCKATVDKYKEIVLKNQNTLLAIFGSFTLELPMRVSFLDLPIELITKIFSEADLFEQWYDYRMENDIHFISNNRQPMTFLPLVTQGKKRKTESNEITEEAEEEARKTKKIKTH